MAANQLRSDVLTIAHHGSKDSTTPDFLAAVQPCLRLFPPANKTLRASEPATSRTVECAAVPTLRTDTNGAIHILSNGEMLEVSCFVACPQAAAQVNSPQP